MIESPLIAELLAEAKKEADAKATVEADAKALLRVLGKRFGELPQGMTASIRACVDVEQLGRWFDSALDAQALAQFRQQTGL